MTFSELRDATLRLPWGDRVRLLWEITRSLTGLRTKITSIDPESGQTTQLSDLARHRGVLNLTQDPLEYQKQIRSEWD